MVIVYSYVKLPEGNINVYTYWWQHEVLIHWKLRVPHFQTNPPMVSETPEIEAILFGDQ